MVMCSRRVKLFILASSFLLTFFKLKYHFSNCGLDATCVFCSKCFYASDHEGHETKFHVSQGNGGCCDCGDAEAWKVPINCKYHSQASSSSLDTDEKDVDFPDLPSKYVLTEVNIAFTSDFLFLGSSGSHENRHINSP